MSGDLADWIAARRDGAIRSIRAAVSATGLVRQRPGFGWAVRPAPGSVLASPRFADWNPEPDYFHHWIRDAAVVMRVLPDILPHVGDEDRAWWLQAFRDHVRFSLAISDPDRPPLAENPLRRSTRASHLEYLRPDVELQALRGAARLGEPRVAADGTPDLERWTRPQDDGPALRVGCCLQVIAALPELDGEAVARLVRRDLDHLAEVAGRPCIGPWEEEPPRRHAFTLIVQWDALDRGAAWFAARGEAAEAARMAAAAARVAGLLDACAAPSAAAWKDSIEAGPADHDASSVLAILHAGRDSGPFGLSASRTMGTVAALERDFAALYPINADRQVLAMGRSKTDGFFGGNPWYPVTLGFAELHYRLAERNRARPAFEKAEAWMRLIREVAPAGDALPEQFDRRTGAPVSSLGLTWSAAAFVAAAAARDAAVQAMRSR